MKSLLTLAIVGLTFPSMIIAQTPKCILAGSTPVNNIQIPQLLTMVARQSGLVYNVGHFTGQVDFDPGPAEFNLISNGITDPINISGYEDIYISIRDTSNQFVGAFAIGGPSEEEILDVAMDETLGVLYLLGRNNEQADLNPDPNVTDLHTYGLFILKTDLSANLIWVVSLDKRAGINSLKINTATGELLLSGTITTPVDLDPGEDEVVVSPDGSDGILMALTADGEFKWAKQIDGPGQEFIDLIELDQNKSIVVTGRYQTGADFDPGETLFSLSTTSDGRYMAKYSETGDFLWAVDLKENETDTFYVGAMSIDLMGSGDIAITGVFNHSVDMDAGLALTQLVSKGQYDIFINRYTQDGQLIWSRSTGGSLWDSGEMIHFEEGTGGALYYCGAAFFTVDFDPGPATYEAASAGSFLSKLNRDGELVWVYLPDHTFAFSHAKDFAVVNSNQVLLGGLYYGREIRFNDFLLTSPHVYYNEVGYTYNALLQEGATVRANHPYPFPPALLYPNPVQDHLTIQLLDPSISELNYSFYNPLMQSIQQGCVSFQTGIGQIPTDRLSSGAYTIQLTANGKRHTLPFIKLE